MSISAAISFIDRAIEKHPTWGRLKNVRKTMNINPHCLNLSYSVFRTNNRYSDYRLTDQGLQQFHSILTQELLLAIGPEHTYYSLSDKDLILDRDTFLGSPPRCLLVYNSRQLYLLGYTYNHVRTLLSTVVKSNRWLRDSELGADFVGVSQSTGEIFYKSRMELGHYGSQTPFSEVIRAVLSEVGDSSSEITAEINAVLNKVATAQSFLSYEFINTSDNNSLGSGIVNLVIQPKDINAKISLEETKLYRELVTTIQKYLPIVNIPGSNTLLEDARQFISDKIVSALSGKSHASIVKHKPVKSSKPVPSTTQASKVKKYTESRRPQLRTVLGQFYSLANLQRLLDANLTQKIKENMGSGNRRDILNLRSGRFAESVKVERMSQSREGMITAFYTYMKNPYQTFEPGFKQGSPNSRNPRLLISKSIREIAATQVANRMRAVLA